MNQNATPALYILLGAVLVGGTLFIANYKPADPQLVKRITRIEAVLDARTTSPLTVGIVGALQGHAKAINQAGARAALALKKADELTSQIALKGNVK